MTDVLKEITKEEYMSQKNKSYKEINKFIQSRLPISILCGYGYYGGCLIEDNGKYYMRYSIGSSCD